jgi:hypothetical protein
MASKKKQTRKIPPGDRLRYLRRKVASGMATDAEEKELEQLSSEPAPPTTLAEQLTFDEPDSDAGVEAANPISDDAPPVEANPISVEAPPVPPVEANPISTPKAPPAPHRLKSFIGKLPVPSATRVSAKVTGAGKASEDWTKPYTEALKGAGRETTVLFLSGHVMGVLKGMSDALKGAGIKPIVDIESNEYKAALVLTVHEYLPSNVVVKPSHILAFGGVALTGQTFYHRKALVAHAQKQKDREAMAKRTRERIDAANPISDTEPKPDLSNVVPLVSVPATPAVPDAPAESPMAAITLPEVPAAMTPTASKDVAGF